MSEEMIVCKLDALPEAQRARHAELVEDVMGSLPTSLTELPHGYAFEYRQDPATLARLAEWVGLESQCCAFFSFTIAVAARNGPIRLEWTGTDAAAKAIIATTVAPVNPTLARLAGRIAR